MAYISAISYHVPSAVLTNDTINREHPEWSIEKIAAKTGIHNRHIAAADEFSSDLAEAAALKLFSEHNIDKSSIDFLLLCTQSPDYFLPTTACLLQARLGLSTASGALDFNLGCSGFVYGLGLAQGLVVSQQARNVLLITAETYSKFINPKDKSNKTLFGDAAAACLISAEQNGLKGDIGQFVYGTDGIGGEHLIVKNGGMRNYHVVGSDQLDENGEFTRNDDNLYMDGRAIFNFTAFKVPVLIEQILEKHGVSLSDIDLFVFHQANAFMLETIRRKVGIPKEKFFIHMESCGNTVSSTIPIALWAANNEKLLRGKKVLLAGFGVGLSWGATIIQF